MNSFRRMLVKLCQVEFQQNGVFKHHKPFPSKKAEVEAVAQQIKDADAEVQETKGKDAVATQRENAQTEKLSVDDSTAEHAIDEEQARNAKSKRRMLANLFLLESCFLSILSTRKPFPWNACRLCFAWRSFTEKKNL